MGIAYLVIAACIFVFGGSAVWALLWAIRSGEFADLRSGATSIFDDEEPVGLVTDGFPQKQCRNQQR